MESFAHPRGRVSVFKCGPAGTCHQSSGTQRFVFAVITIELPPPQTAAGIDNLPAGAAENLANFRGGGLEYEAAMQSAVSFRGCGEMRDQRPAASARSGRKTVGAAI